MSKLCLEGWGDKSRVDFHSIYEVFKRLTRAMGNREVPMEDGYLEEFGDEASEQFVYTQ